MSESANMKGTAKVSLIMPAYNEKAMLKETLESYTKYIPQANNYEYEILVVCNGCQDETPKIAEDFSRANPLVRAVNFPEKIGKGGAIKKGLKLVDGDIIAFVDADLAIKPYEVWKLIDKIKQGDDCTIGSRMIPGALLVHKKPIQWRFMSKGFNILVRLLFRLPVHDTQCGAKAFRKEVVQSVVDKLQVDGMTFDVELLWRIKQAGYKIDEVPIIWEHVPKNGITNDLFKTTVKMAYEVARLFLKQ